jgi:hypothetical protein
VLIEPTRYATSGSTTLTRLRPRARQPDGIQELAVTLISGAPNVALGALATRYRTVDTQGGRERRKEHAWSE